MEQSRFQEFIGWLVDNLFDIVTVLVAGILVARYQLTPPTSDDLLNIVTWILGVLGLIAISGIWERNRRLTRIEKSTNALGEIVKEQIVDKPSATRFFETFPELDAYFKTARTIDLLGVTLTSTLDRQASNLRESIKAGAVVRVIVADPSPKSAAIVMSTLRSEEPDNKKYYQKKLAATFENLEYLDGRYEGASASKGSFNVHLIKYAPSFGIMSFDYEQPHGIIFVEIYPHGSGYSTRIAFSLTKVRDRDWYTYFQGQFNDIWHHSAPWQPKQR